MPLPPTDKPAAERSANPARIMLNSPLAASMRARVFHQRTRQRPRERGLRALAGVGALVLHLLFLFGFVLGPAYQPKPPHESKAQLLQVRLIEPPEPPPPPPVRGTPPKERGPRHQGRSRVAPSTEASANAQATEAAQATPKAATPVVATATKASTKVARPVAAPAPPVALPKPAPVPDLQPVPLASEPPTVELPTPVLQPPVPPKFQPESVRRPQLEGNQAMPPPPSLAMPELPPQAAPAVALPSIALNTDVPKSNKPASINVAPAELSGAPPVPALQPVPLPAQPSPSVNLQSDVAAPTPTVPQQRPQIQAPDVEVAEAELEAVPITPAESANVQPQAPAVKLAIADTAPRPSIAPSIAPAQLSAPAVQTATPTPQPATASAPAKSASVRTAEQRSDAESTPAAGDVTTGRDVSKAPDATPQGSDSARVGEPDGAVTESPHAPTHATAKQPAMGDKGNQGDKGDKGKKPGTGQPGGNQPGADHGEKQGALGSYVQLKPHGDTDIMQHGAPNIGYKATRFERDWAPEGESSIDTALRHAVEKTTVSHTFHLPRGVRIKCAVMPLLPMALLGCSNPDPPAKALADKVYDRLHLTSANPVVPPSPTSIPVPAAMVPIDNGAECSAARVSGAPPPPGCQSIELPVKPSSAPAASSSSWVPASDQFH
ncbi:MAG: hypothetical protein ABI767_14555 [Rhodanobacter sp.]